MGCTEEEEREEAQKEKRCKFWHIQAVKCGSTSIEAQKWGEMMPSWSRLVHG